MSTPSVQNLEEAANIAAEYITTLDNVPSEVQFLLQEIRTKESRCQAPLPEINIEIQQELARDTHKYIKHSLRSESESLAKEKDKPQLQPPIDKLQRAQQSLATLGAEKIALANRVVEILSRKRGRLEYDLNRVLVLQGEVDPAAALASATGPVLSANTGAAASGAGYVLGGRNPVHQINESLRNAFAGGAASSATLIGLGQTVTARSASTTGEETVHKKRKLNTTQGSIKLPSPAPPSYIPATTRGRRGRKRGVSSEMDDFDFGFDEDTQAVEGADGEEGEEGEEGEDKELYCFCQKLSYGEMIACDNPDCPYQWFHLPCVNLKQPLPERWFCAECTKNGMGAPTTGPNRKGRKK
ncbi:hypothetical protein BJ138DRAFT_1226481 [Hygrophoropsis aurantiaca]|uniref:Uncharacterized protein n=1 Tax=Hygrophoropsis aurantiaca TaxID=72124 RepID=A0ACB8AK84_9AGAM|nr:hypothetical protein BJ138DRAFT_1226481 [Hygrophoropsis aurantiaca]